MRVTTKSFEFDTGRYRDQSIRDVPDAYIRQAINNPSRLGLSPRDVESLKQELAKREKEQSR